MSNQSQPDDRMRGRVPGSGLKLWLLLSANRWVLTGVLLSLIVAALVVLGTFGPESFRETVESEAAVTALGEAMVAAIITGVTLVVAINQLVLSQELGAVGDQQARMSEAMEFRRDVESHIDEAVSPAEPAAFFDALLEAMSENARSFSEAVQVSTDPSLRTAGTEFADELATNATRVRDDLASAEFGTFRLLNALLDFNYSYKIYKLREIQAKHRGSLSDDATQRIETLLALLQQFGPAREHFKTLYFQWELINLSRAMLYTAAPALLAAISMILFVGDPAALAGATLGIEHGLWLVSLATAATLLPFVLLTAYILRIVTIAKRTLAIGPFVLRETDANRK